ncbi:MAG: 2OG-Fe(II) oxygenase family protein [Pseudomonadota bacterium]
MLNTALDIDDLASQYAADDRVRIQNLLQVDFAERVHAACRNDITYEYLCHVDGQNLVLSESDLASLSPQQFAELQQKVTTGAGNGVGFFYGGYQMNRASAATDAKQQFVHSLFDFMNSDAVLTFINRLTGRNDIVSADAQFTRYTPGHFLTRHKDDITRERREIAYVLGFSRRWHPDWGGLLHFYEDEGTPRDAWIPEFNTLSLFDVRHVHSVSYVTPFAQEPRLSLTGWFQS